MPLTAEEAFSRVERYIAEDPEAELARLYVVRGVADIDAERMPGFTQVFLRDAFAASEAVSARLPPARRMA